jgi:hypothetical protein
MPSPLASRDRQPPGIGFSVPNVTPQLGRYTKGALPAYRYRPGVSPHPTRSPEGHSYQRPEVSELLDPEQWSACRTYLRAIDLFNHRFYWEAHEELEPLWQQMGSRSPTGTFLQGLIQLAAALLKRDMGEPAPAARLAARGCAKLRTVESIHLGIHGSDFASEIESCIEAGRTEAIAIRLEGLEYLASGTNAAR